MMNYRGFKLVISNEFLDERFDGRDNDDNDRQIKETDRQTNK